MTPNLASHTFPALGTTATVVVAQGDQLELARARLDELLQIIDGACSRFRTDSELNRVNEHAGSPVAVGPVLLAAVDVAIRAARLTDGDVDPTIGAAMRVLGYDRSFADVAASGAPLTCVIERVAGWQNIRVDHDAATIRIPEGVELDLGATAKAYAADWAAATIGEQIGGGVLVSLGGDVAVAGPAPNGAWPIRVTDDHAAGPDQPGELVAIHTGGLATSSTTVRRWRRGAAELHHIVDPSTSRPAGGPWRTVSVAAGSCVDANTASTAAVIRGAAAPSWLSSLGLAARLVRDDGEVMRVGGWPAPDGRR